MLQQPGRAASSLLFGLVSQPGFVVHLGSRQIFDERNNCRCLICDRLLHLHAGCMSAQLLMGFERACTKS